MNEAKPFWKSKTFWLNVASILGLVLADDKIKNLMSVETYGEIVFLLNIGVRFLSSGPVTTTQDKADRMNK